MSADPQYHEERPSAGTEDRPDSQPLAHERMH